MYRDDKELAVVVIQHAFPTFYLNGTISNSQRGGRGKGGFFL